MKIPRRRGSSSIAEDSVATFMPLISRNSESKLRNTFPDIAMKVSKNRSLLPSSGFAKASAGSGAQIYKSSLLNYARMQKNLDSLEPRLHHETKREGTRNKLNFQESDDTIMVKVAQLIRGDLYVSYLYCIYVYI